MTGRNCQVLYVKYNSTRCPAFRITTEVCEDAEGLFVRKSPAEAAARTHLEDIHKNGLSLQDYYDGIQVITSEWAEDALRFPYIEGQTLAEQIDARHFEKARFVAQVNERLERVLRVQEKYAAPFQSSPEFEAIFGKVRPESGAPALNPANIDSQLSNFIENDTGLYCIDCEWVCRFPVPVEYVKYRALRYLYVNQVQSQMKGIGLEEMLGWFGFTKKKLAYCEEMEMNFLQHVHGTAWKYVYTERYRKSDLSFERFERLWRLTRPFRRVHEKIKAFAKSNAALYGILQMGAAALKNGPAFALRNRKAFFRDRDAQ